MNWPLASVFESLHPVDLINQTAASMKVLAGLAAFWPLVAGAALNITYYQNVPLAPTPLPP